MAEHPSTNTRRFFICAHTHWDREWYGTFQDFRMRLVRVVDEMIELLRQKPEFKVFHLDGQLIPILDYVQIRPERAAALRELIESGRVRIGPWFVLADEFIVSGEALIRNLQLGARLMKEWGGSTRVGYSPDCFGRPAQMPQILAGFGLKYSLIWRGFSHPDPVAEAWWESPDGTRLLTWVLPQDHGYADLAMSSGLLTFEELLALGHEPGVTPHEQILPWEGAQKVLERRMTLRGGHSRAASVLLLAGVDHQRPHALLPELIAWGNDCLDKGKLAITGWDEFFDALGEEVEAGTVQPITVRGPLRNTWRHDAGVGAYILPGVLSSRIHQKQRNHEIQLLLERYAEPLCAFGWSLGREGDQGFLREAWRNLLENHPHDSICGCSVDGVHRQMESRFDAACEIAEYLCDFRLQEFADEADFPGAEAKDLPLVVYNPLPWARDVTVEVELQWRTDLLKRYGLENPADLRGVDVCDAAGNRLAVEILGPAVRRTISKPQQRDYFASTFEWLCLPVRIAAPSVPPCGLRVFRYRSVLNRVHDGTTLKAPTDTAIENGFLALRWVPGEGVELTDKTTGRVFRELLKFEDSGDNGDLYGFSAPLANEVVFAIPRQASVIGAGPVSSTLRLITEMELPEGLDETLQRRSARRRTLTIRTDATLYHGSRRVEFVCTLENPCRNHRLRVLFPTGAGTGEAWSDGAFHVDRWPRQVRQPKLERGFFEEEPTTFPLHTFAAVEGSGGGIALFSRGLPEFQPGDDPNRTLALTLLRAVKSLGSLSINSRQAPAGPPIETPEAQCLRPFRLEFALQPFDGDWQSAEIWKAAQDYQARPRPLTAIGFRGKGACEASLIEVSGEGVACSAIRQSESGDHLIVRLWNTGSAPASARIAVPAGFRAAARVRLDETSDETAAALPPSEDGRSFECPLKPHEIGTVRIAITRKADRAPDAGQAYPVWKK